jgi:hypothetical protein
VYLGPFSRSAAHRGAVLKCLEGRKAETSSSLRRIDGSEFRLLFAWLALRSVPALACLLEGDDWQGGGKLPVV